MGAFCDKRISFGLQGRWVSTGFFVVFVKRSFGGDSHCTGAFRSESYEEFFITCFLRIPSDTEDYHHTCSLPTSSIARFWLIWFSPLLWCHDLRLFINALSFAFDNSTGRLSHGWVKMESSGFFWCLLLISALACITASGKRGILISFCLTR